MVTVTVIEDNRLLREGIADMLDALPDMRVVLAATSAETERILGVESEVVLLDVGLQDGSSLRLAERLRQGTPGARVIVMDLLPAHEELAEFVNVGVVGFILKDASFEDFIGTIRAVAAGERVLPPVMATTLFSQIAGATVRRTGLGALDEVRLTQREHEVMALIAEGLSNKEIAQRLDVATETVKSHVRNIMVKLVLRTRLQIAAYAHGLDA